MHLLSVSAWDKGGNMETFFQSFDFLAFPAEMSNGEAPADDEDDRVRESRDERLKREALSLEHMTLHDRKNLAFL